MGWLSYERGTPGVLQGLHWREYVVAILVSIHDKSKWSTELVGSIWRHKCILLSSPKISFSSRLQEDKSAVEDAPGKVEAVNPKPYTLDPKT